MQVFGLKIQALADKQRAGANGAAIVGEDGKGQLLGAAEGVDQQIVPPQSRLRGLPNAVLTPHIAWATREALQRLLEITTNNLRTFLAGRGDNIVNG